MLAICASEYRYENHPHLHSSHVWYSDILLETPKDRIHGEIMAFALSIDFAPQIGQRSSFLVLELRIQTTPRQNLEHNYWNLFLFGLANLL
jgi:hypothetical protein